MRDMKNPLTKHNDMVNEQIYYNYIVRRMLHPYTSSKCDGTCTMLGALLPYFMIWEVLFAKSWGGGGSTPSSLPYFNVTSLDNGDAMEAQTTNDKI